MKVSIITPFKNSFKTFKETYRTVINQTYKDFEWIIVDDKSDLSEFNNLKNFVKDSRVIIYSNNGKPGPGGARNFGLEKLSGDFLTFIDSDDLWELDYMLPLIFELVGHI